MRARPVLQQFCAAIVGCLLSFSSVHASVLPATRQTVDERYLSALRELGREEYETAIQQIKNIIVEHPTFHRAYRKLVEVYIFLGDLEAAENYFRSLLELDPKNAYAHYALARVHLQRKEYDLAIEELKTSIALDPTYVESYGPHGGLAEVYKAKKDIESSIRFFSELLQSDSTNACAVYGLARSYMKRYDWNTALRLLHRAVELDRDLLLAYQAMASVYWKTGRYGKSKQSLQTLLKRAPKQDELEIVANTKLHLGGHYFLQGDYWQALRYFSPVLRAAKEVGAKKIEGKALNNIAAVYATLGERAKAIEYFKAALEFVRKSGAKSSEIIAVTNIGHVYKDDGNYDQALKYYGEALELSRLRGFRHDESFVLTGIAEVYQLKGDYRRALEYHEAALEIAQDLGDKNREGYNLRSLGSVHKLLGKTTVAIGYLRKAVELGLAIRDAQTVWEGEAELGSAFEKLGDKDQAVFHYARAISLYDSVKSRLGIESLGLSFLEDKYAVYPSIVQLLADDGRITEAFTYAEKSKAKSLLDVLSKGHMRLEALVPDTVRIELKRLRSTLESTHAELSRELAKKEKDQAKILSLDQEITDLELRKAAIVKRLEEDYASYVQLTSIGPLEIGDIRRRILHPGQVLVEYIVGPERLSIFVITPDTLVYRDVAVSRATLVQLLADFSALFQPVERLRQETREQIFNAELADFSIPAAYTLYDVLIQPVEPWLGKDAELIIVPDDVLFYLPFEALVTDTSRVETRYDFARARFLVEEVAVSYVASAALLDPRLQRPRSAEKGLLALGNPDFSGKAGDETVLAYLASAKPYSGGVVRGGAFVPLPNSEAEVKAIRKALGGATTDVYIGERATEEVFKKESGRFRILHLATHFLANDENPLYSKIVLAQRDQADEDGYLQTYEVFNLRLNADLVVLSACNTALGKLRKGEGLIGISRAFLYAGVPSLVVSLWSVDDEATSILMANLYKYLRAGLPKNQALRLAKVDYLKSSSGDRKDPFFWAPFILLGDWSPIDFPPEASASPHVWLAILLLSATLLTGVAVIVRRRHTRRSAA